ncbi:hypothetical protein QY702_22345 [Xanthomonas campestris pv. plantaginis]|uniref:hypothetical protein n=1 Tax=Xanthomonas campestris TaxID=339 RepID=UPI002B233E81|nr:hypothetical protein [Xanthomonas campestris]MEA9609082.1 hypothetical protein [Xanthomonas campestris pv. plantaginis]
MKLKCIGRDQIEREFDLRIQTTFENYPRFMVTHESISHEFFELILKPLDDDSHMVMMINAHNAYGGFGIPDAIIPFAASHLSTELRSSPTISTDGNYWRTPAATKVWERLVAGGKAEYNKETDIYRII